MKKSLTKILLLLLAVLLLAACGRGNDEAYEDYDEEYEVYETEPETTPEPEPEPPAALGMLTGLPIYEGYLDRRPLAVVVNNDFAALPQDGLLAADVFYEVLVEAAVTRILAVFQSQMPERVGPIRSARYYFIDMAFNHDAIFVHHGATYAGYARIRETGINNLDGIALETSVFWRDRSFPEWSGMTGQRSLEHSSFSTWERILTRLESHSVRQHVGDGDFGFNFGEIPEAVRPIATASVIAVPFSNPYARTFTFENDAYLVSNPRGPHVDAAAGQQVAVQNVLVQLVPIRVISGSVYRDVDTVGSGQGYLFTNGQQYEVQWTKASPMSPMVWTFADGSPLVLTPGKTWINVLQDAAAPIVE